MVKYMYGEGDNKPDIAEAGEYPATIKTAEEKISKNDNPMIELMWELESGCVIFDYLVFTPKTAYKVDAFIKSVGIEAEKGAELNIVAEALEGKRAFIDVGIEEATDQFKAKNKVLNYICDKGVPPPEPF